MSDRTLTPKIAIIDEDDCEQNEIIYKRSNSFHIDSSILKKSAEQQRDEVLKYCANYSLTQSMDALVSALLREQPLRPTRWCEQFIRTADQLRPDKRTIDHNYDRIDPREFLQQKWSQGDAPLDYIEKFKLASLFSELLSQLLTERPVDPLTFCLSWLRWHRHTFEVDDEGRPLSSPKG
jgi:hypothetical protein